MQYDTLAADAQRQLLNQRLAQYEAEHFQHTVNRDLIVASGDTSEAAVAQVKAAVDAMAVLDQAHAEVKKRLAALATA